MAERSKAAVSKTVNGFFPFGGSNPPLSAMLSAFKNVSPVFPFPDQKNIRHRIVPGRRMNYCCAEEYPYGFAAGTSVVLDGCVCGASCLLNRNP